MNTTSRLAVTRPLSFLAAAVIGLTGLGLLPACYDLKSVSVGDAGSHGTGGAGAGTGGHDGGADTTGGGSGGGAPPGTGGGGGGAQGTGGNPGGTGGVTGTGGGDSGTGGALGSGGGPGTGGGGGTTGTGGSGTGGAPPPGTGGTPGDCGALIDDMESGTGYICEGSGRIGHWFTYVDSGGASSITPAPSSTVVATPYTITPARGTSTRAMRAFGTFASYAGIACLLNTAVLGQIPKTFDATAAGYTGIKFYARGLGGIGVVVNTSATISTTYGGACTQSSCIGNMYFPPSGTIAVDAWTLVTVPFSMLAGGSAAFRAADLWSIGFQPALPGAFDIWIDDLSFY
jgi:hypothetical protein